MTLLVGHVGVFITLYVLFDTAEHDPYVVRMFCSALAIGVDLLDLLVELNPNWKHASLWSFSAIAKQGHGSENVADMLLGLFKFKKFQEARRLGAGGSCRGLIAASASGLSQVVAMSRADPLCIDFHFHGFSIFNVQVRKCCIICGLVSFVCEDFQP